MRTEAQATICGAFHQLLVGHRLLHRRRQALSLAGGCAGRELASCSCCPCCCWCCSCSCGCGCPGCWTCCSCGRGCPALGSALGLGPGCRLGLAGGALYPACIMAVSQQSVSCWDGQGLPWLCGVPGLEPRQQVALAGMRSASMRRHADEARRGECTSGQGRRTCPLACQGWPSCAGAASGQGSVATSAALLRAKQAQEQAMRICKHAAFRPYPSGAAALLGMLRACLQPEAATQPAKAPTCDLAVAWRPTRRRLEVLRRLQLGGSLLGLALTSAPALRGLVCGGLQTLWGTQAGLRSAVAGALCRCTPRAHRHRALAHQRCPAAASAGSDRVVLISKQAALALKTLAHSGTLQTVRDSGQSSQSSWQEQVQHVQLDLGQELA